jgi:alkanesulfonate monooxygenase SsuD/methylene tetrahydromethanopterin reductase-like flavin-dependent oxidoreductase (luciferase family)
MQFGLFGGAGIAPAGPDVDGGHGFQEYVDFIIEAEKLGYCSTFVVEHHFTGGGDLSASLNLLTWLGARTSTIRLGTAVIVLPWHNPVLLAEQVATLDVLTGGRVDFGVGKGYRHNEFAGFCVPIEESAERFEEALDVIVRSWTSGQRFSHHGKHWRFEDIIVGPPVTQSPHPPIWMGAGSPESITAVAERGYNLLLDQFATIDVIGERISIFRREVERRGRAFDPASVAVARSVHVARNRADTEAAHERRLLAQTRLIENSTANGKANTASIMAFANTREASEEAALYGTPDEIAVKLDRLRSFGAEYILMAAAGRSLTNLRRFASELMPHYGRTAPARAAM